jgi:Protein of unknown function (DUF3617)
VVRATTVGFKAACVACVMSLSAVVQADDLPQLAPGLWRFERSVQQPGVTQAPAKTIEQCIDPTADIRRKRESLATQGCHFSPISHEGDRYAFSAGCSKNGLSVIIRSALVVVSEHEYRVITDAQNGKNFVQTTVVGHRVGECAK